MRKEIGLNGDRGLGGMVKEVEEPGKWLGRRGMKVKCW